MTRLRQKIFDIAPLVILLCFLIYGFITFFYELLFFQLIYYPSILSGISTLDLVLINIHLTIMDILVVLTAVSIYAVCKIEKLI